MDQAVRNKLRNVVTQCRKLLEDSVLQELQGKFGIYAAKKDAVQVDDEARMTHLSPEGQAARKDILDHFEHIKARGFKPKEVLDQLVREVLAGEPAEVDVYVRAVGQGKPHIAAAIGDRRSYERSAAAGGKHFCVQQSVRQATRAVTDSGDGAQPRCHLSDHRVLGLRAPLQR